MNSSKNTLTVFGLEELNFSSVSVQKRKNGLKVEEINKNYRKQKSFRGFYSFLIRKAENKLYPENLNNRNEEDDL